MKLVAWRNVVVHRYLGMDYRRLYEDSKRLGNIVKEFERQVISYIGKHQGRVEG